MVIDDFFKEKGFRSMVEVDSIFLDYTSNTSDSKRYNLRTDSMDSLYRLMITVFGTHEKARRYFFSDISALDNKSPHYYCRNGNYELIFNELKNIELGDSK